MDLESISLGGTNPMSLRDTVNQLSHLLESISKDLVKANRGYKAAAQRVRTGTVKLEKLAKIYRKESVVAERGGQKKKKTVKKKSARKKR